MQYPIIPCDLCGSQENLQRQKLKDMLAEWEQQHPGRIQNIARSLRTVVPSHLGDTELFDFHRLSSSGASDADTAGACGDITERAVLDELIPLRFFARDAVVLKSL